MTGAEPASAPRVVSPAEVAALIGGHRFRYRAEGQLQEGIAALLDGHGIEAEREARLSAADRIDLLAGGTGIEVKVAGRPADVARQLRRYAASPLIEALVLVTTRAAHRNLPREIGGKPLTVVWLSGVTG